MILPRHFINRLGRVTAAAKTLAVATISVLAKLRHTKSGCFSCTKASSFSRIWHSFPVAGRGSHLLGDGCTNILLSLAKASSPPEKKKLMWILFSLCKCAADSRPASAITFSQREWATAFVKQTHQCLQMNRRTVNVSGLTDIEWVQLCILQPVPASIQVGQLRSWPVGTEVEKITRSWSFNPGIFIHQYMGFHKFICNPGFL